MRRLAERPQNLSLAIKEFTKPKILKKLTLGIGIFATLLTSLILGIKRHKNKIKAWSILISTSCLYFLIDLLN